MRNRPYRLIVDIEVNNDYLQPNKNGGKMLDDFSDGVKGALTERLKHPILGVFSISFAITNFEVFYYIFQQTNLLFQGNLEHIYKFDFSFKTPAIITLTYILLMILLQPILSFINFVKTWTEAFFNWILPSFEVDHIYTKKFKELEYQAEFSAQALFQYHEYCMRDLGTLEDVKNSLSEKTDLSKERLKEALNQLEPSPELQRLFEHTEYAKKEYERNRILHEALKHLEYFNRSPKAKSKRMLFLENLQYKIENIKDRLPY